MDYLIGLSVFLTAVGAATTGVFYIAYRYRHRHDGCDGDKPELPLRGGRTRSRA